MQLKRELGTSKKCKHTNCEALGGIKYGEKRISISKFKIYKVLKCDMNLVNSTLNLEVLSISVFYRLHILLKQNLDLFDNNFS